MTVIQFADYQPDFNNNSKIFFPVHSEKDFTIQGPDGEEHPVATGHTAIIRSDTHQVVGIHGSRYKLTPNLEVFPAVDETLKRSDLSLRGMQVKDEISHNGARTFRQYLFPDHDIQVGRDDTSFLRLLVNHSYDGSSSMTFEFGAYRQVCSNGMVLGDAFSKIRHKNTLGIDVGGMLGQLNSSFHDFLQHAEEWKRWVHIPVTIQQVQAVIDAFPAINDVLATKLMNNYLDERQEFGDNLWSLFNALTQWSSHEDIRDSRAANSASIIASREVRVKQAISTPQFTQLALAA
jgi:hypothetical protein